MAVSNGARVGIGIAVGAMVLTAGWFGIHALRESPPITPSAAITTPPPTRDASTDAPLDAETHATDLQGPPVESHLAAFYAEPSDERFARSMRPEIESDVTNAAHRARMIVESVECRTATCIARLSTVRDDLGLAEARAAFDHPYAERCTPELLPSFLPDAGLSSLDILIRCPSTTGADP